MANRTDLITGSLSESDRQKSGEPQIPHCQNVPSIEQNPATPDAASLHRTTMDPPESADNSERFERLEQGVLKMYNLVALKPDVPVTANRMTTDE